MPTPSTTTDFVSLIRQSRILAPDALDQTLRSVGTLPDEPIKAAAVLIKAGVITQFQAKQLVAGKYRGLKLGPYVIRDQIGQGGMGTVLLGEHEALKRKVALKILSSSAEHQPGALERFLREARSAAALDHPNIVRLFDVAAQGETHYLVLEYVEGQTLEQMLQAGPLSCGRAVEYVAQAALGLQHAADKGFVHRDIKPANLIVTKDGTVKILDMGLARSQEPGDKLTEILDQGAVTGSADYIAPEQAMNSPDLDIRADVYSLGLTLYALLAGRPPFDGTVAQKLLAHQVKMPPRLTDVDKTIPQDLADVVERMVAKKPDDRYQTPAEVASALAPWRATGNTARDKTMLLRKQAAVPNPVTAAIPAKAQAIRLARGEHGQGDPNEEPDADDERKPNRGPFIALAVGGGMAAAALGLALVMSGGNRHPPETAPTTTAASTVPPTVPLANVTQTADPNLVYSFDPKAVVSFRAKIQDKQKTYTLGSRLSLPAGIQTGTWRPNTEAEFWSDSDSGGSFIALTNLSGDPTAQYVFDLEDVLGVVLERGKKYRVVAEYRGGQEALGNLFIQRRKPESGNGIIASARFGPTAGQWKTVTASFTPESDDYLRAVIAPDSYGEEGVIAVRKLEIWKQPEAQGP